VDVAVAASQKGLLLPPGLAVLCVSDQALRAAERARLPRYYFDWAAVIEQNRNGYFPYTPATQLLLGLDEALNLLFEEGLSQVFARHALLAEGVRRAVSAWGLALVAQRPEWASNSVSAIRLPEGCEGDRLVDLAASRFHLALGTGLGPLQGRAFRIGHLGSLNALEVLAVLGGVELALRMLAVPVELGRGVAAAQTWFLAQTDGLPE
jgi:alanine-glyoxylate transaminase/serine-glyoxylate transaminase/serine-pyruvate transaminase